jgi:diguanylate cyclase (GGDEF)-like protein
MALAGLSFVLATVLFLQRFHAVKIGWAGRVILILLLQVSLFHLLLPAAAASRGWPPQVLTFCDSLSLLTAAAACWPFLQHIRQQDAERTALLVKDHVERAGAQFTETRDWLKMAEKIAHVGHWRYDVAAQKLTCSDEMYEIHGQSKNGPAPDLVSAIAAYHPDDREIVARSFMLAISAQQDFEVSVRLMRTDGQTRYILSRGVVQTDGAGKTVSVFGVFMDVTGQKEIEQELKNANVAGEIANKLLQEMALEDSLTMLPNRRKLDATMATELKRAAREKTTMGLIMIDLDHFKGYNDRYGHPAGDECLRQVAGAIAGVLQRPADMAARYGGEEIAVLLPNTNLAGTEIVAELILKAVRDLRIAHEHNQGGFVTVSCGIAAFDPENDPQVPVMLIERADQALYTAKQGGRNRVGSRQSKVKQDYIN